jgi:cyclin T
MDRRVLYTASVYFHRFYLFHTFQKQNRFHLALACLFLGGKVEEKAYKLKELVLCYHILRFQRKPEDSEYRDTFKQVILAERLLLHTLNFDLTITHPYNIFVNKMRDLRSFVPEDSRKPLMQTAVNFLNDSYRSSFCLEYTPCEIAIAVLYLATIALSVRPVNPNSRSLVEVTWVSILDKDIREYRLRCLCLEILDMYEHLAFMLRESEDVRMRIQRQRITTQLVAEMGGVIPGHLTIAQEKAADPVVDEDNTTLDALTPREKALSFVSVAGDKQNTADCDFSPTSAARPVMTTSEFSYRHHQSAIEESFASSGSSSHTRRPTVTVTKVSVVSTSNTASSHHHPLQTPSSVAGMDDLLHNSNGGELSSVSYLTSMSTDEMHTGTGNMDDTPVYFNRIHETASDTPTFSDLAGFSSGNNSAVKSGMGRGRQRSRSNSLTDYAEFSKRVRAE